ncbi:MAG: hypothetical protein L0Y66_24215, partial [Myxococcaceae bacterium]|nr:hypothetical protein [Myxococcaceae bacterium]
MRRSTGFVLAALVVLIAGCATTQPGAPQTQRETYDLVIRNGLVYDGSGGPARRVDVGVRGDRVVALGALEGAGARSIVDAGGKAVAPGF